MTENNAVSAKESPYLSSTPNATSTLQPSPSPAVLVNTTTAPNSVAKREYRMSPYNLYRTCCRCLIPSKPLADAAAQIDLMIERLDKLMGRLARTPLHHEVKEAGLLILHTLRLRGMELFHLIGWESTKTQGSKSRVEYSVGFAVPDQEDITAHRVVAQLVVQVDNKGRFKGTIDTVSVRFEDDWDDWTAVQDVEYLQDEKAGVAKRVNLDAMTAGTRSVAEQIWDAMPPQWGEAIGYSKAIIVERIGIAIEKMEMAGEVVNGFEVGETYRKLGESRVQPAISIRLHSHLKDSRPIITDQGNNENVVKTYNREESKEGRGGEARAAAIILIEMKGKGQSTKVKHVSVIYDGEWSIIHRYRKNSPPPNFEGLEELVKETRV